MKRTAQRRRQVLETELRKILGLLLDRSEGTRVVRRGHFDALSCKFLIEVPGIRVRGYVRFKWRGNLQKYID